MFLQWVILSKPTLLTLGDKVYIGISGVISAIAAYGFTDKWSYTIVAAALGIVGTGLPRIIIALTGARKSYSEIVSNEVKITSQLLKEERDTVRLVRISKHNLSNACIAYEWQIAYLESLLKANNITFVEGERFKIDDMIAFEKDSMKQIVETQLNKMKHDYEPNS